MEFLHPIQVSVSEGQLASASSSAPSMIASPLTSSSQVGQRLGFLPHLAQGPALFNVNLFVPLFLLCMIPHTQPSSLVQPQPLTPSSDDVYRQPYVQQQQQQQRQRHYPEGPVRASAQVSACVSQSTFITPPSQDSDPLGAQSQQSIDRPASASPAIGGFHSWICAWTT
jgi:hypothetical protein